MKKWLFLLLFFWFLVLFLVQVFDVSYLFHGLRCTYLRGEKSAQIDDHRFFYNDTVFASKKQPIPFSSDFSSDFKNSDLERVLEKSKSVAFLVIKNDSLCFEKYWDGVGKNSSTNSFSVAKSITSLLVGCAIRDGFISSVEQSVSDFIPELGFYENIDALKIKHLLEMSSGLDWLENYKRPISVTAEAYYGTELEKLILDQHFIRPPGSIYNYQSGNTQILGLLLERAVGEKISSYASKALWCKIGAENNALWTLDYNGGLAKTFCCFNSNARDFAKIGLLMLNQGRLNGNVIIEEDYVDWLLSKPTLIDGDKKFGRLGKNVDYYSNSWWTAVVLGREVFYARGFLGQYIVVIPDINVVFVRLGKKENAKSSKKNEYMLTDNLKFFIESVIEEYSTK